MSTFNAFIIGNVTAFIFMLIWGQYLIRRKARKLNLAANTLEKVATSVQNRERNILGDLRRLNPERCKAFGHEVKDMSVLFWATELAGETGELCNWIKKQQRGDQIPNLKQHIAKEAADVLITLDLLCIHQDIDLQAMTVLKFNEVSDRVNSPIKL